MKRIWLVGLSLVFLLGGPGGTEIPRAGTGQDGELLHGVTWPNPRFTDNGDVTVTDNLTGLMWTKDANLYGTRNWTQALSDCESCTVGGYDDWHLPQRRELFSLVHDVYYNPSLPNTAGTGQWTRGDPFTNVQSSYYWTSTTSTYFTYQACGVGLLNAFVIINAKRKAYYVWCVRGGSN